MKKMSGALLVILIFLLIKTSLTVYNNTKEITNRQEIDQNALSIHNIAEDLNNDVFEISTLLGGNSTDYGYAVELDSHGNIIATGTTGSVDFPTQNGFNDTYGGLLDGYVVKLFPNGTIIWSTFIGGSDEENSYDVVIDGNDDIYITGYTDSTNFPALNSINNTHNGISDVFLTKFSENGSLMWSMMIGGNDDDVGTSIGLNSNNEVIIAGHTKSTDFPIKDGYQENQQPGTYDIFFMKFSKDGSLIWSSFLGGSDLDYCEDIKVDNSNNIILTGQTISSDFPLLDAFDLVCSGWEGYVSKFTNNCSMEWSTYIGGSLTDGGRSIAVDKTNNIIVVGYTYSTNFPVLDSFDGNYNGMRDGFFSVIDEDGELVSSSFIGGTANDFCYSTNIDSNDNLFITGTSHSLNFPTNKAYFSEKKGTSQSFQDVFVSKFHLNGSIQWSTYMGGLSNDIAYDIVINKNNNAVVIGYTDSDDYPRFDNSNFSVRDIFLSTILDPEFDTDNDNLSNFDEHNLGLNLKSNDTDNDLMPDGWEIEVGLNATLNDSYYDSDSDKLLNIDELKYNTDPLLADTDKDLIPDGWEIEMGLNATIDDAFLDNDNDGMNNLWEFQMDLNATIDDAFLDNDNDNLPNLWEFLNGLNASDAEDAGLDKDYDGLTNLEEFNLKLNPNSRDSDLDLIPDQWEVIMGLNGSDPTDSNKDKDGDTLLNYWEYLNDLNATFDDASLDKDNDGLSNLEENQIGTKANDNDTDGDLMPDGWESRFKLNPLEDDSAKDLDNDMLSNLQEYQIGTEANNNDTDGDLMPDGWEVQFYLNPLINDADNDQDNDGLTNLKEYMLGTTPTNSDTDFDGYTDGFEKKFGTNPLSAISNPLILALIVVITFSLFGAISILPINYIYQKFKLKKRIVYINNTISAASIPLNLATFADENKLNLHEVVGLCQKYLKNEECQGILMENTFFPKVYLFMKYKIPDLENAVSVLEGGFPDYETFKYAKRLGAKTIKDLEVIRDFQAPDYATALRIREGHFLNYNDMLKALELGVQSVEQLELVKKYKATNFEDAIHLYKKDVLDQLGMNLKENGLVFLINFMKDIDQSIFTRSNMIKEIKKQETDIINTDDWNIILTKKYVRKRLLIATKIYADLSFDKVAEYFGIPIDYIHEILVKLIEINLIKGMIDRTTKQILIREITSSFIEQMKEGQLFSTRQIEKEYNQSIEKSLKILQNHLPSNQYVLTREKELFGFEQINFDCQICGVKHESEKYLKCQECLRELCWDHFNELGTIGRPICPYCDGQLIFLPVHCEKCNIDYITILKKMKFCEYCGYSLKAKDALKNFYNHYLVVINQPSAKTDELFMDSDKKR